MSTFPQLDASVRSQIERSVNIILPSELELQNFRKEVKSVLIETSRDVFVISNDDGTASVGSTTHIPLHKLSNKYVAVSTEPETI